MLFVLSLELAATPTPCQPTQLLPFSLSFFSLSEFRGYTNENEHSGAIVNDSEEKSSLL
jgi:hypothetical protein